MAATSASKDSTTLTDFLRVLRVRKSLIVLIVALVFITTLVVTALLPRWYLSTTKIRVEKPDEITPAWERAFASPVPTVIDALASPDVPPIPPHIEWKQAKALMSALLTGDPDTADIVRQASKQTLLDLLPGRG